MHLFYTTHSWVCFVSQILNLFRSEGHLNSFTFIVTTDRFDLSSMATLFNDADFVMFTVFLRGHSLCV